MYKIESLDNKLIKQVKKLLINKKYRYQAKLFVAESFKLVSTILKQGFKLKALLITKDSKYFPNYCKNPELVLISNSLYKEVSTLENGDGIIAIFNLKEEQLKYEKNKKYIILDKIQDPANLGTILRTAFAFSIDGIIFNNSSVDVFNYKTLRNCMGYGIKIPTKHTTDITQVVRDLNSIDIQVYATVMNKNSKSCDSVCLKNAAILLGNEGNGLNKNEISSCNGSLHIKTNEEIDSLNLNAAAAIFMYLLQNEKNKSK